MLRGALIGIPIASLALMACGSGTRGRTSAQDPPPRPAAARARAVQARRAAALAALTASCERRPPERPIERPEWLSGFIVTEYYPVPERWFDGASVSAPGNSGRHRVDWLYSANGVSMEGDGIDLTGRPSTSRNWGLPAG